MSVCLRTKWLWLPITFLSLKLQISHLFKARSSLTFWQLQSVDWLWNAKTTNSFTRNTVINQLRVSWRQGTSPPANVPKFWKCHSFIRSSISFIPLDHGQHIGRKLSLIDFQLILQNVKPVEPFLKNLVNSL